MTIEESKKLIKNARETGKITNCLCQYSNRPGHYYSKPLEVKTMILQIFAVMDFKKNNKEN